MLMEVIISFHDFFNILQIQLLLLYRISKVLLNYPDPCEKFKDIWFQ